MNPVRSGRAGPAAQLTDRARALRALHRPGDPLVLPNVWDAASARAVVTAGFPAVATSSAAMAEALGFADHEGTPPGEMFDAVARVARAVAVPVTADLERGYRLPPAELVERTIAAGAVGCNLEDSDPGTGRLVEIDVQVDLLAAVAQAAREAGVPLVVNARVDTYLRGPADGRLAETLRRAQAYLAAGADCVYPIGAADPADLAALVAGAGGPVNVLLRPGTPDLARLAELGVARVSLGSGVFRAVQAQLAQLLAGYRRTGPAG